MTEQPETDAEAVAALECRSSNIVEKLRMAAQCESDYGHRELLKEAATIISKRDAEAAAYARGVKDAANVAESLYVKGSAHTYSSENADRYIVQEETCELVAKLIRALLPKEPTTEKDSANGLDIEKLRALMARIESATGPDREIDYAISIVFKLGAIHADEAEREIKASEKYKNKYRDDAHIRQSALNTFVTRYTKSIGAATDLIERVLPESGWLIGKGKIAENEPLYGARVFKTLTSSEAIGESESDHGALALLAAMIQAVIAAEDAWEKE